MTLRRTVNCFPAIGVVDRLIVAVPMSRVRLVTPNTGLYCVLIDAKYLVIFDMTATAACNCSMS